MIFTFDMHAARVEAQIQRDLAGQTAKIKRAVMHRMALSARKIIIARTRQEIDLDGVPYPTRWHKRSKPRTMLTKLALRLSEIQTNEHEIIVGWRNSTETDIASKQQFGQTNQLVTKAQAIAALNNRSAETLEKLQGKATRSQAKALLALNFKIRRGKGGTWRTPTIKWITENMTIEVASTVIRALRGPAGKESWTTTLPARSFVGLTDGELQQLRAEALSEIQKQLRVS